jgi:predicted ester cyclase
MFDETKKTIARRTRELIWNQADAATIAADYTADSILHVHDPFTPDFGRGPEAVRQLVGLYRAGFPDARCTVEDIIPDGDRVVVRWSAQATHTGPLLHLAPTGRPVSVRGIDIYRFAGDQIAETWISWDALSFCQQLGIAPAPSP